MAIGSNAVRMGAMALAALVMLDAPEAGAQNQAQQPRSEVVGTHGDWEKRCIDLQAQGRRCALVQMGDNPTAQVRAVATLTRGGENGAETVARFEVPIGVHLPSGLRVHIDGQDFGGVPYQFCHPDRCAAIAILSAEQEAALKGGSTATITFFADPKVPIEVPISLMGVTAGLRTLE
ncbi:MAG: hypothetical protein TEF_15050 [Rhizobiales bacterium NRL2]|jgi:invasion protein IalB|nr:MAG: hypothetical protein TEF_15050 [Rhizobiales bacterium NRL2]